MKNCKTCNKILPEYKEELYCNSACIEVAVKKYKKYKKSILKAKDNNSRCVLCNQKVEIKANGRGGRKYCGVAKDKTGCAYTERKKQCIISRMKSYYANKI